MNWKVKVHTREISDEVIFKGLDSPFSRVVSMNARRHQLVACVSIMYTFLKATGASLSNFW